MKSFFAFIKVGLFITSFFILWESSAQKKSTFKTIDTQAKENFRVDHYEEALPLYLKLDSLKPNNSYILTRIGICYLHTEFKFKALPYLTKAKEQGYSKDHLDFFLGHAYHLDHQFDNAIASFQVSKSQQNLKLPEDQKRIAVIDRYIEMCNSGKVLVKNPIDVKIENLGSNVNSSYPEYAPVISADETVLIFTSRRPGTTGEGKDEQGDYFEDIYISTKENDVWTAPKNIGTNINTNGHDASIGLSADGQELLIYKHDGAGDIYYSTLQGEAWSAPIKMLGGVNTPKSWEPSASITSDEKILFFASDREGGFGGRDIYVTRKLPNGEWALPKNLGPNVNTAYDDDAPFIHPDGNTLYFSSKGHNSMGGFDIFTVQYNSKNHECTNLTNVGYPINTADDDIFFVWSADGKRGYFSSIRPTDTYGEKDLYVLTRPQAHTALIVLKGKVFSKTDNHPLSATITVTDNETKEIVGVYNSNSYTGKYTIIVPPGKNYGISVQSAMHLPSSENVFIPKKDDYFEVQKDFVLEPLQEGSVAVLKNVFFDFGSAELRSESNNELEKYLKVLKENPTIHIEVAGHTDNVGSHDDNHNLSQKRAMAVSKFFVDNGIDPIRLCAFGYGETVPVASNDTDEGRQQNRRTEIIIIETLKEGHKWKGCDGFYNKLKEHMESSSMAGEKANSGITISEKQVKELSNIYFEFNSSKIEKSSRSNLDLWIKFLKANKNIKIELGGHTDGKGSEEYNNALSNKRMNAVKEYFISKGINSDRITTVGYGESKPVESNETDEGRSKNRRVEITILQ